MNKKERLIVASKCKEIDDALAIIDQKVEELDSYGREVENQNADPTITPEHQKFDQAVKDKGKKIKKNLGDMSNPKDVMTEEDINPIIKNKFKGNTKEARENRERVRLVHQLVTLMKSDPDFNATADEVILNSIKNLPFQELRDAGRPIQTDSLTGKVNLYTVPIEKVRQIFSELVPYMDVQQDGKGMKARGLIDSNLAFEFYLPKNVIKSAATKTAVRFKHSLYRWRNKLNAMVASYSGPIDINPALEKEMVHGDTKLPIMDQLRRSKAGYTDVLHILQSSLFPRLRQGLNRTGIPQIKNMREMFQVISDLMQEKAFIISEAGEHFGKVYMWEKQVPKDHYMLEKTDPITGEKYEVKGDRKHEWKGKDFTKEEREAIEKRTGRPLIREFYAVPYMTNKTKSNPEGIHLNFNEEGAGDKGENLATMVDSTLQHLDVILKEVGRDRLAELMEAQNRFIKLVEVFKDRNIPMPPEIFGQMQQVDEDILSLESQRQQDARVKSKKLTLNQKVLFQDGTMHKARIFHRYYPRMYFIESMPPALKEGIENIERELEVMAPRMVPNPEATPEQQKVIDRTMTRYIELTKAKRHLEMSFEKLMNSDAMLEEDSKMPDVMRPFEKHFKSVSHMIPYKYVRNDANVIDDYVKRVNRSAVKTNLMLDMLDLYKDVDSPTFRNYIVNQYRKAFGDVDSEGSIMGWRFTNETVSKGVPGTEKRDIQKFFQSARSYSVFANLSGMTTGIANMAAHINKVFETGAQKWFDAFQESQLAENQKSIIKSGIMSFQDVIENHIMINGNSEEKRQYRKLKAKWKKRKKEGSTPSEKQMAVDILHAMKKNRNPIMVNLRNLANWAISGEIIIDEDDSVAKKAFKTVVNVKKRISMQWSERSVRATSYQMGVNQAKEAFGVSADDPIAMDLGKRFVEELDFSLGAEGVGDMFGNDIMQWLMHIRVWSVQRMAYGKDALLNAWRSVRPYSDEEKFVNHFKDNTKASWEFVKALTTTFMGSGLTITSPIVAGLAVGASGGLLPGLGGAIAGLGGAKVVQKVMGAKERQKALRFDNPDMAKASQMLLFHGAFAMLYDFIIFNANMNFGTWAGVVSLGKKIGWRTGAHKFGPSFAAPELRFAFMSMAMLFKASREDDELDKHDFVKLIGSVAGIGYMQIMYLVLSMFEDQNALVKGSYQKQKDYKRMLMDLNFPKAIKDIGIEATDIEGGLKKLKYSYDASR